MRSSEVVRRSESEWDPSSNSEDSEDELVSAVLQLQKEHFKEPLEEEVEEQGKADSESSAEDSNERCEDIPLVQKPKACLPNVAEAFSNVSTEFTPTTQNPKPAYHQHKVSLNKVEATKQKKASASVAEGTGLPDEGQWHVPLTAFDVIKSKRQAVQEEQRKTEKDKKRREREAGMVKHSSVKESDAKKRTAKEREKAQRLNTGRAWQPEAWMTLRQQFD